MQGEGAQSQRLPIREGIMKRKVKIIVTDMDGTVLDSVEAEIKPSTTKLSVVEQVNNDTSLLMVETLTTFQIGEAGGLV